VADIDEAAALAAVESVKALGADTMALVVDLTDYAATTSAISKVEAEFGPIDILVNNAGWDPFVPFLKSEPDFWSKIIDINLRSVLNITKPVFASMVARRAVGRIVSIASDAGRVGSSGESVYAACKAGIIAFSKTLAREHARHASNSSTTSYLWKFRPGLSLTVGATYKDNPSVTYTKGPGHAFNFLASTFIAF